jgi:hypothetical protein
MINIEHSTLVYMGQRLDIKKRKIKRLNTFMAKHQ